jgi:rhodanese-related sulfurtransferase
MTSILQVDPTAVAALRDFVVVDIRSASERYCGEGFIPGSISIPEDEPLMEEEVIAWGRRSPLVLACLTGRRSVTLAKALKEREPQLNLANLTTGLLGWIAEELPVAGRGADYPSGYVHSPASPRICRAIASCFVAETVELSLDSGELNVDPMETFSECCVEAGVDPNSPSIFGLLRVLDFAAQRTRELGNDYERIGENIDKMLGMLGLAPDPAAGVA